VAIAFSFLQIGQIFFFTSFFVANQPHLLLFQ
jgi:hypothetical protein